MGHILESMDAGCYSLVDHKYERRDITEVVSCGTLIFAAILSEHPAGLSRKG